MSEGERMPVEELSGRELDYEVCREVFGDSPSAHSRVDELTGANVIKVPEYSSEPMDKDTWGVVEKVDIHTVRKVARPYDPRWVAYTDSGRAIAPTAPLAICRAALRAVRASNERSET